MASPWAEDDRLQAQEEALREKRLKAEMEAVRLRKQERLVQKRRKELWAQEKRNVEELALEEGEGESLVEVRPSGPTVKETIGSPTGFSQVSFGSLFDRMTLVP